MSPTRDIKETWGLTATLTYEERLGKVDAKLEELQQGFVAALEHLRQAPQDQVSEERWKETVQRLKDLRYAIREDDYDREQLFTIAKALLDIRDLLESDGAWNLDICDQLMVQIERIRHVVRDALDEHVEGGASDVGVVLQDLARWLPNVPDHTIARFVGVDRRTLSRWREQAGTPRRTLRVFARLVAILRHNWDEEGILAWFDRPRRDLDDRRPGALIADPDAEAALISAARSGRSQYGA
jgi:uncharacterized protein (DUF2384 family)